MCTNPLRSIAPFATKYCNLIQNVNFTVTKDHTWLNNLPVLANGNTSIVLRYVGRALHEIIRLCGQFDLNFGSKMISGVLLSYVTLCKAGSPSSCMTEARPQKIRADGVLGHIVLRHAP
jgi:hypothetical protein